MAKEILITKEGLDELKAELDYLKAEKRLEIAEKIKVARSFGDLSENSEYDEAKNDQAKLENRINEIETILKHYKIIDEGSTRSKIVNVGTKVKVLDVELDEETEYKIVGSAEADPLNGKISDESPIGKALLGHKEGETVVANTPQGDLEFKIVKIIKKK
ncbi:MAG: transcription elongation factor GreA [Acutalibacteraceae bacterium]|nr:transcription elongation factor GreA [Acutalibacteraceae bacterium]